MPRHTAGAYRFQHVFTIIAQQKDHRIPLRFLQRLEQAVLCANRHRVRISDDGHIAHPQRFAREICLQFFDHIVFDR